MALGIKAGDEVITTPFTFLAMAEVITLLGVTPVFVDINQDTCNINAFAEKYGNIPVIEDAAQSFGATYKGKKSCNLSTIGCTSFFPSKTLGCYGDGHFSQRILSKTVETQYV